MTTFASPATINHAKARHSRLAKPRAALVVYRYRNNKLQFLLVSTKRDPRKFTLPGGKFQRDESARHTAVRETIEEAGVLTKAIKPLSTYLHRKKKRRVHPTTTFLARYAGQAQACEDRDLHWLTLDQVIADKFKVRAAIREQLALAECELRPLRAAA